MYLIQCVNAYVAAAALAEKEWDYQTAHALVTLKRRLQPQVDFFTQKEMLLVEEFAVKDEKGKVAWTARGGFTFAQPERAQEYADKRSQLGMVEVQEDWKPIRVKEPERIKPTQLEALEGFLVFGEEERECCRE